MVQCPVCEKEIPINSINKHLDRGCEDEPNTPPPSTAGKATPRKPVASIFQTPTKRTSAQHDVRSPPPSNGRKSSPTLKRQSQRADSWVDLTADSQDNGTKDETDAPAPKRQKKGSEKLQDAMPLAEKVRPKLIDDICGQDLVGPEGVLRGLIEKEKVPSMILWGSAGCGKTTIARVIAQRTKCRFVEISATDSGVGECKKIFQEAKSELLLTGRKTILFCDEIHRFSKSQQDVFLAPVESGQITL